MESILGILFAVFVILITAATNQKAKVNNRGRESSSQSVSTIEKALKKIENNENLSAATERIESMAKSAMKNDTVRDVVSAFKELVSDLEDDNNADVQAPKSEVRAPQPSTPQPIMAESVPEGVSFSDADGCIGGSMHEHVEEGERAAEHAQHLPKAAELPVAAARRRISAAELRRAVITSEILDKPIALRRRA